MAAIEEQSDASVNQIKKRKASVITDFFCKRSGLVSIVHEGTIIMQLYWSAASKKSRPSNLLSAL